MHYAIDEDFLDCYELLKLYVPDKWTVGDKEESNNGVDLFLGEFLICKTSLRPHLVNIARFTQTQIVICTLN